MTQQLHSGTNRLYCLLLLCFCCQSANGSTGEILQQVETFTRLLVEETHPNASRIDINVRPPDSRISLDDCAWPEISQHGDNGLQRRLLVKLHCSSSRSIHLVVDIAVYKPVLMTTAALARQTVIGIDDVILRDVNILSNNRPLLTKTTDAIGKKLKRSVRDGMILTAGMLIEPTLINRGDSVVIVAKKGSLMVRMPGTALSAGALGQQISVRNESSERTVKGWIHAAGEIYVPF